VHFTLGRVGAHRQRRAPLRDLGLGDAAAGVAPLVEDVGGDGGDVGIADVALRRHEAVVRDAVDDDLALEAGQDRRGDLGRGPALQPVGAGKRREGAGQALAVGLVAGGAVLQIGLFAGRRVGAGGCARRLAMGLPGEGAAGEDEGKAEGERRAFHQRAPGKGGKAGLNGF
jgi:hypothetical protein